MKTLSHQRGRLGKMKTRVSWIWSTRAPDPFTVPSHAGIQYTMFRQRSSSRELQLILWRYIAQNAKEIHLNMKALTLFPSALTHCGLQ